MKAISVHVLSIVFITNPKRAQWLNLTYLTYVSYLSSKCSFHHTLNIEMLSSIHTRHSGLWIPDGCVSGKRENFLSLCWRSPLWNPQLSASSQMGLFESCVSAKGQNLSTKLLKSLTQHIFKFNFSKERRSFRRLKGTLLQLLKVARN